MLHQWMVAMVAFPRQDDVAIWLVEYAKWRCLPLGLVNTLLHQSISISRLHESLMNLANLRTSQLRHGMPETRLLRSRP
jgi:hypothetical protein